MFTARARCFQLVSYILRLRRYVIMYILFSLSYKLKIIVIPTDVYYRICPLNSLFYYFLRIADNSKYEIVCYISKNSYSDKR